MASIVARWLRELRYVQPFNRVATAAVRAAGGRGDWFARHLPRVGEVRAVLPNGRTLALRALREESVASRVFWGGWAAFEPEASRLFYVLAGAAGVVLDVGAYTGYYALLAAHANPRGRVVAFEPLARVFELLMKNAALNGVPNLECVMAAAGREEGLADFFFCEEPAPSSSSLSREFMKVHPRLSSVEVRVVALDRFVAERRLGPVDLVKIDTETTEPDVLAGLRESLRRDKPDIFCEVLEGSDSGPRIERLLNPLGYSFYQLTGEGPRRWESIRGHARWSNYLLTAMEERELSALERRARGL